MVWRRSVGWGEGESSWQVISWLDVTSCRTSSGTRKDEEMFNQRKKVTMWVWD
jgi:hypothetical protein